MFEDERYRLMGAAFEVYNHLGYGMAEEVYQQCLAIELKLRHIPFASKETLNLVYKGQLIEKTYVPDLLVFGAVIVELKAVTELSTDHEAQIFNYMRIAQQHVGYLLNFGRKGGLEWKRFILSDLQEH